MSNPNNQIKYIVLFVLAMLPSLFFLSGYASSRVYYGPSAMIGNNEITSAMIQNDGIVNADINATASIRLNKLESTTTNYFVVSTSTGLAVVPTSTAFAMLRLGSMSLQNKGAVSITGGSSTNMDYNGTGNLHVDGTAQFDGTVTFNGTVNGISDNTFPNETTFWEPYSPNNWASTTGALTITRGTAILRMKTNGSGAAEIFALSSILPVTLATTTKKTIADWEISKYINNDICCAAEDVNFKFIFSVTSTLPTATSSQHFGFTVGQNGISTNPAIFCSSAGPAGATWASTTVSFTTTSAPMLLRAEFTMGTKLECYINNVLKATITTNLPTSTDYYYLLTFGSVGTRVVGIDLSRTITQRTR